MILIIFQRESERGLHGNLQHMIIFLTDGEANEGVKDRDAIRRNVEWWVRSSQKSHMDQSFGVIVSDIGTISGLLGSLAVMVAG